MIPRPIIPKNKKQKTGEKLTLVKGSPLVWFRALDQISKIRRFCFDRKTMETYLRKLLLWYPVYKVRLNFVEVVACDSTSRSRYVGWIIEPAI